MKEKDRMKSLLLCIGEVEFEYEIDSPTGSGSLFPFYLYIGQGNGYYEYCISDSIEGAYKMDRYKSSRPKDVLVFLTLYMSYKSDGFIKKGRCRLKGMSNWLEREDLKKNPITIQQLINKFSSIEEKAEFIRSKKLHSMTSDLFKTEEEAITYLKYE